MNNEDKSQRVSTGKIMLIWKPANFWYSEFDMADAFRIN